MYTGCTCSFCRPVTTNVEEQEDWREDSNWQMVAEWIKEMVRYEPEVMRQVADMQFGDLGEWIEKRDKIGVCGCLVGSTAIALTRERDTFEVVKGDDAFRRTKELDEAQKEWGCSRSEAASTCVSTRASDVVKHFVKELKTSTDDAGIAASRLGEDWGNYIAVRRIKAEIRSQLAERLKRSRRAKRAAKARKQARA